MNIRKFIATGLAVFAALWVLGHCTACGAGLTPAEQAAVAQDGLQLSVCAAEAHLCKHAQFDGGLSGCWDEYDRCMVAHGFADAGPARTLAFANDNGHPVSVVDASPDAEGGL